LASFDLGNERIIKVVTGDFDMNDEYLPILYELNINGKVVEKSFLYSESFDRDEVNKHRFSVARDKSNQMFLLLEISPETGKLYYSASFDLSIGFRSAHCGLDRYCNEKAKEIWNTVKNDNSELNFADATFK
jgi:hypothetical protein